MAIVIEQDEMVIHRLHNFGMVTDFSNELHLVCNNLVVSTTGMNLYLSEISISENLKTIYFDVTNKYYKGVSEVTVENGKVIHAMNPLFLFSPVLHEDFIKMCIPRIRNNPECLNYIDAGFRRKLLLGM